MSCDCHFVGCTYEDCGCGCHYENTCMACGDPGCAGYCDDYQTYNLRPAETGYQPTAEEETYMAEHHPTAMLTVEAPAPARNADQPTS